MEEVHLLVENAVHPSNYINSKSCITELDKQSTFTITAQVHFVQLNYVVNKSDTQSMPLCLPLTLSWSSESMTVPMLAHKSVTVNNQHLHNAIGCTTRQICCGLAWRSECFRMSRHLQDTHWVTYYFKQYCCKQ